MNQKDIIRSYLRQAKYASAPNLTLAKKIYADGDNNVLFSDVEAVRHVIRKMKGKNGKQCRAEGQWKNDVEEFGGKASGKKNPFPAVPKAKKHFSKWEALKVDSKRCLILSDIHAPFHDEKAVEAAVNYGKEKKIDTLILNGDCLDFFSISRWEKNPLDRCFGEELKIAKAMFNYLRKTFPKARIIFKDGNHEERWLKFMTVKAIELLDVECFSLPQLLSLAHFKIEHLGEKRPILLNGNDFCVIHGHEFYGAGSGVNWARGYQQKTKMNTISGHLHRPQDHVENMPNGDVMESYASGCLCDLNPDYSPLNNWGHSFIYAEKKGKQKTKIQNIRIVNGEIV